MKHKGIICLLGAKTNDESLEIWPAPSERVSSGVVLTSPQWEVGRRMCAPLFQSFVFHMGQDQGSVRVEQDATECLEGPTVLHGNLVGATLLLSSRGSEPNTFSHLEEQPTITKLTATD